MAPDVQDLILSRLDEIHVSVNELRDDFHDKLLMMNSEISSLKQWKETHEKLADEDVVTIRGLSRSRDQLTGALKAVAFFEAFVATAVALLGWLHLRK